MTLELPRGRLCPDTEMQTIGTFLALVEWMGLNWDWETKACTTSISDQHKFAISFHERDKYLCFMNKLLRLF